MKFKKEPLKLHAKFKKSLDALKSGTDEGIKEFLKFCDPERIPVEQLILIIDEDHMKINYDDNIFWYCTDFVEQGLSNYSDIERLFERNYKLFKHLYDNHLLKYCCNLYRDVRSGAGMFHVIRDSVLNNERKSRHYQKHYSREDYELILNGMRQFLEEANLEQLERSIPRTFMSSPSSEHACVEVIVTCSCGDIEWIRSFANRIGMDFMTLLIAIIETNSLDSYSKYDQKLFLDILKELHNEPNFNEIIFSIKDRGFIELLSSRGVLKIDVEYNPDAAKLLMEII